MLLSSPLFPSWRKEHSFLPHKGVSVSGSLSLISHLPVSSRCLSAALAVQPAEHADVWVGPGMQSCPGAIFHIVCNKVVGDRQESRLPSQSSPCRQNHTTQCTHAEGKSTVGRPAARSSAPISQDNAHACTWCCRRKPLTDTNSQEACSAPAQSWSILTQAVMLSQSWCLSSTGPGKFV